MPTSMGSGPEIPPSCGANPTSGGAEAMDVSSQPKAPSVAQSTHTNGFRARMNIDLTAYTVVEPAAVGKALSKVARCRDLEGPALIFGAE